MSGPIIDNCGYLFNNRYNDMEYSKVPEEYEAMFRINGKVQTLDTKRNTKEDYVILTRTTTIATKRKWRWRIKSWLKREKAKKKRKGKKTSATR